MTKEIGTSRKQRGFQSSESLYVVALVLDFIPDQFDSLRQIWDP